MKHQRRLPLGTLLRDESTGNFFLVVKTDLNKEHKIIYYLCCILDTMECGYTTDFKYYFTVGEERVEKYTVLNTHVKIRPDGTIWHILSTVHPKEIESLVNNSIFMERLLTMVKFYSNDKKLYQVDGVLRTSKKVHLDRKSTILEKLFIGASRIGFTISWFKLLSEYVPYIKDDFDILNYTKNAADSNSFLITDK